MIDTLNKDFTKIFHHSGKIYKSGGIINLIGEYTNFCKTPIIAGVTDKYIFTKIKLNIGNIVKVYSCNLHSYYEFPLKDCENLGKLKDPINSKNPKQKWILYIFRLCQEFLNRGYKLKGFDAAFIGNIPFRAGMSSSTALISTFACAINNLQNFKIHKKELFVILQECEKDLYKKGIDKKGGWNNISPFISLHAKQNNLIFFDSDILKYKYIPFEISKYHLLIVDTSNNYDRNAPIYDDISNSCNMVLKCVQKRFGNNIESLTDANISMVKTVKRRITKKDFLRAEYVINEKQRIQETLNALSTNDFETIGKLMYEDYYCLKNLYKTQREKLDYLMFIAKRSRVTGARPMNREAGGSTINLVRELYYNRFISYVNTFFYEKFKYKPSIYEVSLIQGTHEINIHNNKNLKKLKFLTLNTIKGFSLKRKILTNKN